MRSQRYAKCGSWIPCEAITCANHPLLLPRGGLRAPIVRGDDVVCGEGNGDEGVAGKCSTMRGGGRLYSPSTQTSTMNEFPTNRGYRSNLKNWGGEMTCAVGIAFCGGTVRTPQSIDTRDSIYHTQPWPDFTSKIRVGLETI